MFRSPSDVLAGKFPMTLNFTKASGAGNDFVILDNRDGILPREKDRLAIALCSRPFGIGADGLLVIEPSNRADFTMLYFNSDGTSGGMCGNGGRCAARYAMLKGIAGPALTFETLDFVYRAEQQGARIRLHMKDPGAIRMGINVDVPDGRFTAHFVDTGAPHAVVVDDQLETRNVAAVGRALRHHEAFAPSGANINFLQFLGEDRIAMRTYERGVEAETLACGTGSAACSVIASLQFGLRSPIRVLTRSGEELEIGFREQNGAFTDVTLTGSAHMLYAGSIRYNPGTGSLMEPTIDTSPHHPGAHT